MILSLSQIPFVKFAFYPALKGIQLDMSIYLFIIIILLIFLIIFMLLRLEER